jgi:hypothetical protein
MDPENTKNETKFVEVNLTTTEKIAEKLLELTKKGKIEYNLPERSETDTDIIRECTSKPLPSGGILSLVCRQPKGKNKDGKSFNPKYNAYIRHNSKEQELRGKSIRELHDLILNVSGIELEQDKIELCNDFLAGT